MSSLQQVRSAKPSLTAGAFPYAAHSDALLTIQARVFELVALDRPIELTLTALCQFMEDLVPSSIAGVTVLDRPGQTFESAVFPSLPLSFSRAIEGIGVGEPHAGTCAAAVSFGDTVACQDVNVSSSYDKDWIALCLAHGIKAIRSVPAYASDGSILGTFVLGFPVTTTDKNWESEAVKLAAHVTGVALEHDRKRKQQELLVGELRHRIRNVFTIVASIAQSTFREYPGSAPSIQTFLGRLKALSKAHCLPEDQHVLSMLISDVLEPYRAGRSISVSGPEVILSLEAIQAFGLALHELATNAAKYGCLSVPEGSLRVQWLIHQEDKNDVFVLHWIESNGPRVTPPVKSGFGTAVVKRNLSQALDACVSIEFAEAGLHCTIVAPLVPRLGQIAKL